jgi:hypothetical protein
MDAADAELAAAGGDYTATLRAQSAAEHAAGQATASQMVGIADEARRVAEEYDEQRAEAVRQRDEAMRSWDAAVKSEHDIASADGRSKVLGNVGNALAVALGAFGQAFTGGPNVGMHVVDRKIADEVAAQERMLKAAGMRVDRSKSAAVFGPTPGTPGILSTLSPTSASQSTI